MALFAFLFRSSRSLTLFSIVAGAFGGAAGAGLLVLVHQLLGTTARSPRMMLNFVGLCGLLFISRLVARLLLTHLTQTAVFDLRTQMGRRILATPLQRLEALGAHRILATLTDDVMAMTNAFALIPQLCINLAIFAVCLVYLGYLSGWLLIGVLAFIGLGVLSFRILLKRAHRILRQARQRLEVLFQHFRALTEGVKELQLHDARRRAFLAEDFETNAIVLRQQRSKGLNLHAIATVWGQLLFFICVGLLLFVLPSYQNWQAETIMGYILVLLYMRAPLETLVVSLPILGQAQVAIDRIQELGFELGPNSPSVTPPVEPIRSVSPSFKTSLEFVDVTCTYTQSHETNPFTLGPLNLTLYPSELIFLVGGNGSGKTTLAKLLCGLYTPGSGEIRLDGVSITTDNRDAYRQCFSVVFSDFYLFDRLIGVEPSKLDVQAYLQQLQLDHKVEIARGQLSTTQLSYGQRKRLALLTAYLEDRPIYIFDEWAADQDPMFKEIFYLHLLPDLQARGKTVIVISHDDRYYHVADRIIKLEDGKIGDDTHVTVDRHHAMTNESAPYRTGEA